MQLGLGAHGCRCQKGLENERRAKALLQLPRGESGREKDEDEDGVLAAVEGDGLRL